MELIDRDAILERAKQSSYYFAIKALLIDVPVVDAAPVAHGRWEHDVVSSMVSTTGKFNLPSAHCSICGCYVKMESPFCPDCGAKMDGGIKYA